MSRPSRSACSKCWILAASRAARPRRGSQRRRRRCHFCGAPASPTGLPPTSAELAGACAAVRGRFPRGGSGPRSPRNRPWMGSRSRADWCLATGTWCGRLMAPDGVCGRGAGGERELTRGVQRQVHRRKHRAGGRRGHWAKHGRAHHARDAASRGCTRGQRVQLLSGALPRLRGRRALGQAGAAVDVRLAPVAAGEARSRRIDGRLRRAEAGSGSRPHVDVPRHPRGGHGAAAAHAAGAAGAAAVCWGEAGICAR